MNHDELYALAEVYDVAFSYRDVEAEVDAALRCAESLLGRPVESVLEIASGPGRHARACARRGLRAGALDVNPEMLRYCKDRAEDEDLDVVCVCADMRDIQYAPHVDLALLMLDSASYLLTNEDVFSHLQSVAMSMVRGGVYLVDMCHPRGLLGGGGEPPTWTMSRGDLTVKTTWGDAGDCVDPLTLCTSVTARYEVTTRSGDIREYRARSLQRAHTAHAFEALVALSGCWKVAHRFGSVLLDHPLTSTSERMVYVLQAVP